MKQLLPKYHRQQKSEGRTRESYIFSRGSGSLSPDIDKHNLGRFQRLDLNCGLLVQRNAITRVGTHAVDLDLAGRGDKVSRAAGRQV